MAKSQGRSFDSRPNRTAGSLETRSREPATASVAPVTAAVGVAYAFVCLGRGGELPDFDTAGGRVDVGERRGGRDVDGKLSFDGGA
jgi:hypothetical protein